MQTFDLVLRQGQVVIDSEDGKEKIESIDIGLRGDQIAHVGTITKNQADQVIDASGLHVLPGLIDTQVHFREPGFEHKEDLGTGSAGAALGGVTGVFDMPNTRPPLLSAIDLTDKLNRANGRMWCDFAFYLGASHDNAEALAEVEKLPGTPGTKIFMGSSTGDLLLSEDAWIERVLRSTQRTVTVHCEDEFRLKERAPLARSEPAHPRNHPIWRDEQSAIMATKRLLKLAEKTQHRVHALHITTADEVMLLKENKRWASFEILPQHLTLAAPDCYEELGSLAQMNPPIRDKRHQEALWAAVQNGWVDVLGSDHAPHTKEEKARTYPQCPAGLPGVQTIVPLMIHHVRNGRLSLGRLVELMAINPAKRFRMEDRGRIAPGLRANFTLVDLHGETTLRNADIASKCGYTPFDGMQLAGKVVATLIGGRVVARDGQLLGKPAGQPIAFADTAKAQA